MQEKEDSFYLVFTTRYKNPDKRYMTYEEAYEEAARLTHVYLDQKVYILKTREYLIRNLPEPSKVYIY